MSIFNKQRLGIDLGTANTIIYIDKKGIALREPSIVAINKETQEVVAYGKEAAELVGRTSDKFETISPMRDGVIANFSLTKKMLAHFIKTALRRSLARPEVVICVPSNISKVERRAVVDAVKDLGIYRAMIVEEPYAAALGANLAIDEPRGKMVVDVGGGTTDIAVISYNEIVKGSTVTAAGNAMNDVIMAYVRKHYQLAIGFEEANRIKVEIGNAQFSKIDETDHVKVKGRNVATGVPDEKIIRANIIAEAVNEVILEIIIAIKQVLEVTPPELSADIMVNGIILTGGGALLRRLPDRLYAEIGIPVHLANLPMDCVAIGAGKMLKRMDSESKIAERRAR